MHSRWFELGDDGKTQFQGRRVTRYVVRRLKDPGNECGMERRSKCIAGDVGRGGLIGMDPPLSMALVNGLLVSYPFLNLAISD
jgi:hypothetical protein